VAAGPDEASSDRDGSTFDSAVPQPPAAPPGGSPAAPDAPPAVPQPRDSRWRLDAAPRPRIVDEPGILGLSRLTRGRFGSRLFNWFFVLVFAVILIQMISAILDNSW
jgi:hypothetical protein